jgi:serine/threonine protein kinase
MDLKPNNILIDKDDGVSTVGKWVLTDFGISAFKEDDDASADNLVSVRDYYQNLTINTTPRRGPCAYQPPEVEYMDTNTSERRTSKEGSAGRRGDIWSFACIFAEVLVFSLGQAPLLKEFRTARKGRHKNDYFYELERETLHANDNTIAYRVRPQIREWLCNLPAKYSFPKKAIDCCVETIQRLLVVDGSRRPKAYELLKMFNHVAKHVDSAREPGGPPPNCPLGKRTPPELPLVVDTSLQGSPAPFPAIQIKRTNTIEEENLLLTQHSANGPLQMLSQMPQDPLTPFPDREDSLLDLGSPPRETAMGLGILDDPARTFSISGLTQTTIPSRPSSRESRRDLHGVMVNQDRARQMGAITECKPLAGKIISSSLSPSGQRIAYLTGDKKSQYRVHSFGIITETRQVVRKHWDFHHSNPIPLPTGTEWEHVVTGEGHLVAWGNIREGTKQVRKSDLPDLEGRTDNS